jgi:hypothetical protein
MRQEASTHNIESGVRSQSINNDCRKTSAFRPFEGPHGPKTFACDRSAVWGRRILHVLGCIRPCVGVHSLLCSALGCIRPCVVVRDGLGCYYICLPRCVFFLQASSVNACSHPSVVSGLFSAILYFPPNCRACFLGDQDGHETRPRWSKAKPSS